MEIELTKTQTEAFDYLTSNESEDVCYGGAKGGGKSYLMCVWIYAWVKHLIDFFGLKDRKEFPVPVGFFGRKRAADFTKTTLETWKRVIDPRLYEFRAQDKEIVIDGRAKVIFGGLDDQESINKFNSAELAFIGIDQAEETDRDDISVLEGSLRLKVNGKQPPYKVLYTCNPKVGWLKSEFVKGERGKARFVRSLPSDNPHLPTDYEDRLKAAFGYNSALLQAYLYGEWDVFDGIFFEEWKRKFHEYHPSTVTIQPSWPRFRSIDWGFTSPMACYWHAIGPDQHLYTYREYYKTKQLDVDAAKEIAALSKDENVLYTVADPQSFPVEIPHFKFGKMMSVKRSEVWAEHGVPMVMGDSSRIPGWSRMREYLRVRPYQNGESAWWHISSECPNLIQELTSATFDKKKIEDIDAGCADHALESCRLGMMSRPPLNLGDPQKLDWFRREEGMRRIRSVASGNNVVG